MVSAISQKRALPIFLILLDKKGVSDLREQQIVLRPVIKLFKAYKLVLIRLIFLIALAMSAAWLQGQHTSNRGTSSYICRPKETRRNRRRHSNFWLGLYGHNWIATFHLCQEWVEELLHLIRNKLPFYQRGLRALNLIQQFL
jgi:hypothetical protein